MMLFITMEISSFVCDRVGKDRNNYILIAPSTNVGDRGELGAESCLVGIRNGGNNIRHRPQISYSEAAERGLTQTDLK